VAVNLRAPLLLSQAVVPAMRAAGGGRIIHMASQLGLVVDAGTTVYSLTKAALIQLTRSMALELAAPRHPGERRQPGADRHVAARGHGRARPAGCSRAASPRSPPDASAAQDEIADVVTYLATRRPRSSRGTISWSTAASSSH